MPIVRGHGYSVERHIYRTEDDYINTAFRIPGPKGSKVDNSQDRPVILMQHGLNHSSLSYVLEGPDSLAFFFAEAGFDVWVNNNRGNLYSRQHKFLDPDVDAAEYFNFSLQDLGKYD